MNRILFGPYPLFRIPRRPKAVFLDIEGTLLQRGTNGGKAHIPADILAGLTALSLEKIPLFFATTLPIRDAFKRCRSIWHFFEGGIFAAGAHLIYKREGREAFYEMKEAIVTELSCLQRKFHFRVLACRNQGRLYKITLCRAAHSPWSSRDIAAVLEAAPGMRDEQVRYFTEGSCLQIVSAGAGKANGMRTICGWLGISPGEAAAAGDSAEDKEMLKIIKEGGA